jgi:hypothetical protein
LAVEFSAGTDDGHQLRVVVAGDASPVLETGVTGLASVANRVARDDDRRRSVGSNRASRQISRDALQKNLTDFGRSTNNFHP